MNIIKAFVISVYATISIIILSTVVGVTVTSIFDYKADLLTQTIVTLIVTYAVIFPVVKIRKRLLSLTEKLFIIIPLTALTVLFRLSMTYGNTGMTTPDEKFWITAVIVAITDFIPVWLVISTFPHRIYNLPNKVN